MKHTFFYLKSYDPFIGCDYFKQCSLACLKVFLLLLFFGSTFSAAAQTWTGAAGDRVWTNGANWIGGVAPSGTTGTLIFSMTPGPLTGVPPLVTANNIEIQANSSLTIPNGSQFLVDVGGGSNPGVATVDSLIIDTGGNLTIQNGSNIGLLLNLGSVLIARDSVIINGMAMDGLQVTSGSKAFIESTGTVYIRNSRDNGLVTMDSLVNNGRILITDITNDGIENTGDGVIINNDSICIFQVGDHGLANRNADFENGIGAILSISRARNMNGILHTGGNPTFNSFGTIVIDSVAGNGIQMDRLFNSLNDTIYIGTNHPKTGSGSSVGCTIARDGINITATGTYNVGGASKIFIGDPNCPIVGNGITNAGMLMTDDDGTYIRIRSATTSLLNTGTITNNKYIDRNGNDELDPDDDCVIIDVDGIINVNSNANTFFNNGIILTSAPMNSTLGMAGALHNNGFISDEFGAFLSSLTHPRAPNTNAVLENVDGILVAPYHDASYISPLPDFLITGITPPPYQNQYAAANFVGATFDNTTNELSLNTVTTNYSIPFQIQKAASGDVCVNDTTALTFDETPTDELACNSNIQLSLGSDGTATITPQMILESSHANYSGFIVEILTGSGAGTNVVDCSYLGTTVEVMITAPGASGNRCWGRVTVEDKLPPILTVRDTFIYCNQDEAPTKLGFPTGVDACGSTIDYTYSDKDSVLTLCGGDPANPDTLRIITRTFTGRDQFWNAATTTQTIYVLRPTLDEVIFPDSLTGANALQCSSSSTSTSVTGKPYFRIGTDSIPVEAICKYGINMEEKVYDLGCPGKQRITRTWSVMDWCNLSSGGAIRTYVQLIDIIDTIPPTFDSIKASDIVILSTQSHKCMATIRPPAPSNVQDACSGTTYRILGPSGTIYNDPKDSLTNIPFDTTMLEYIITDSCGNEARDTITFILKDEVSPLALAQELTVNLVDGEGNTWVYASSFDAGSSDNCSGLDSILISKDGVTFDDKLAFGCADVGILELTLKVVDEAGNVAIATRDINISDNGGFCGTPACNSGVVIDTAIVTGPSNCVVADAVISIAAITNGANLEYSVDSGTTYSTLNIFTNQDTAVKYIFVREVDNPTCVTPYTKGPIIPKGGCASFTSQAAIAGHIQNENGETVEAVNIAIGGYEMAPAVTGVDGNFMFEEIPLEGDYMITPEKDMNHGNGITTFDIVLLSKHVLGLKKLDSPYKMIAADINHSGTISAYDMVLLRQVILGMKTDFPNNTSWRFIDANYEFLYPENPFDENYPEVYEIKDLSADMMSLDFIAVKIGDLNNTAAVNQLQTTESRNTNKSLNIQIAEQVKKAGETITVDFKASNFQSILGYQFTLDFDGNDLAFEQIKMGNQTSFENFNLSMIQRGIITTSWNESEAVNLANDEVLFSIVFKAKNDVRISEAVKISSDITAAEAYTGTEEVINVHLEVFKPFKTTDGFKLFQNVPNPFTGETIIGFELPTASATTLTIFDMSGKMVKVQKGTHPKGYNQILLNGKAFDEHGMFYYQLETNQGIETKKMILLKR